MDNINRYLEHTLLKPHATEKDMERLLEEARVHQFVGICVPPFWVKKVKRELEDTAIQVVTVVGFPMGYQLTETKVFETQRAIDTGADEIDVVWSLTAFKSGMNWPKIELAKLAQTCHDEARILKVIIETAYLDKQEMLEACKLCADAGVDYVKTSTGLAPEGAKVEDVEWMRANLPSNVGIKASGGIQTASQTMALIRAGADRIGTSAAVKIMQEIK